MVGRRWVVGWRRGVSITFLLKTSQAWIPTSVQVEVVLLHLPRTDHCNCKRLPELFLVVVKKSTKPVPPNVTYPGNGLSFDWLHCVIKTKIWSIYSGDIANEDKMELFKTYPYVIESLYLQTRSTIAKIVQTARTARQFLRTGREIE